MPDAKARNAIASAIYKCRLVGVQPKPALQAKVAKALLEILVQGHEAIL
jgi:hypothetical protein